MARLSPDDIKILTIANFKNDQIRLGYTNQQMGHFLGYCISHIEHLRSGRRTITKKTIAKINDALKRENNPYEFTAR